MKKSFLTAASFLLSVAMASAGAQSMAPAPGDNANPAASSTNKADQPGQNDRQDEKKDKKSKKVPKVKTKKPASEEDKKNDPMYGIYG